MDNFIGLNIRFLCSKNKLSQKDFGDLFDIKQSTISTYLAGRSNPQVETIQKICEYFKITADEFINIDLAESDKYSNKDKTSTGSKKNTYQVGDNNNSKSNNNNSSNLEDNWKQKFEFLERENALLRELLAEYKKNKD
jgi:transcriptional regulator with XRE-family HTH domain